VNKKRRILIFIDWYLPGYRAGGPTQSCANLIEHLKDDFDFSVVTRDTDYMTNKPYPGIKSNEWNILPDGTRVYYFSSGYLSKKAIYSVLQHEVYDSVYLNGIFSKYFTLIPLRYFRGKDKKVIVASRGMLAESALAIKKWKKNLFLIIAKQFGLFGNVLFHATNEEEAASVRKIFGEQARVHVAPNLPGKTTSAEWRQKTRSGKTLKLVSVARIAPEKNIKYALEVLKDVETDVRFDLYGPVYNEHYWNECKEVIDQLPANIRVNFKDSIDSKLVSETIAGYDFLFLPTQGENFGHVILQAMQVGVPVIISDKTIWKDLEEKRSGWDISLADKNKFVGVIEKCSGMFQSEYDLFSRGAFDLARSYVNNTRSIEQNKELFRK
jgi:glycosyltransferase involved in cell wall biosynthesis